MSAPPPLVPLRNVLKILKSSLSPGQIALGVTLGIFAGLPPAGLHLVLPISAALLLRVSFKAFLIAWGLFELLSIPLAPAGYAIGRALLESDALYSFWRIATHLPVLAPMGYSRYLLLGDYVLASGLAVPAFHTVRYLVLKYRGPFSAWAAGWRPFRRFGGNRLAQFLNWLFLGGAAKYVTARPARGYSTMSAKRPWPCSRRCTESATSSPP